MQRTDRQMQRTGIGGFVLEEFVSSVEPDCRMERGGRSEKGAERVVILPLLC